MDDEKIKSLWFLLQHTEGPIPWPVLDKFAEVLTEDPAIWKSLAKRYNELSLSGEDYFGYEQLYIPAIFAKAAPKLNKETILEISPFLVEKLCEAGFDDDDIQLEVFSTACGSMGAVILPTVIDFICKEENTHGAWIFLWGLLRLAKQADEPIRKQTIDFCVDFLVQADRDEINLYDAELAAKVITWSEEIVSQGMEPANWGMGKSFTMKAEADGVDITDQQSMQRYMAQHNLKMLQEKSMTKSIKDESFDYEPPIPISEIPAKVGRNEPCPCGSGKKYKKCCGGININPVG